MLNLSRLLVGGRMCAELNLNGLPVDACTVKPHHQGLRFSFIVHTYGIVLFKLTETENLK